uniref:Phytocyanin domain-containing protein n=1 Tax=Ananas comosus var. bracteatus TaxID=296719 RepID=A0A6V7NXP1_ANACO|nr:unnamed protein product [Ananas comosus var. bracteatus]
MATKTTMSFSYLCIFALFAVLAVSEAADFLGGSTNAWKIPTSASDTLNQWAAANRFQVGDSLVWKYDKEKDSVIQVTREDYLSCNTSSPIAEHKDGATAVNLARSGAYYFVSGAEGACEKGEKVIVVVMAERRRGAGLAPAPAPTPTTASEGPAVAPTSGGGKTAVGLKGAAVSAVLVLGWWRE